MRSLLLLTPVLNLRESLPDCRYPRERHYPHATLAQLAVSAAPQALFTYIMYLRKLRPWQAVLLKH
jgi:hypothetical protein